MMQARDHTTNRLIAVRIDQSNISFQGGMYGSRAMIDPTLLPVVCPSCGAAGTRKQELHFADPLARFFWVALGFVFLGLPLLFAFGALVTWGIGGQGALGAFIKVAVTSTASAAAVVGLWSARSALTRGQWGLTFHFCDGCSRRYLRLRRWLMAFSVLTVPTFLVWPIVSALLLSEGIPRFDWRALCILASFPILLLITVTLLIRLRRARGLSAKWVPAQSSVGIMVSRPEVAERFRTAMNL